MKNMKIHFINVGYGDAVLIEAEQEGDTPGRTVLIDTGSAHDREYEKGGPRIRVTRFLEERGIGRIDLLVLSHPHEDHIAMALPLMEQCEIGEVWVNHLLPEAAWEKTIDGTPVPEAAFLVNSLNCYAPILAGCRERKIPVRAMEAKGRVHSLSDSLKVKVLDNLRQEERDFGERLAHLFDKNGNVPTGKQEIQEELIRLNRQGNASSLALLFEWKGKRLLLTGDSCPDTWPPSLLKELAALEIEVYKLPHHGQRDSITAEAARAISPRFVVTSSASDRRNGSSHPDCYRLITENLPETPEILFTDEVRYDPYFRIPAPLRALTISLTPGEPGRVEFHHPPASSHEHIRTEVLL